MKEEIRKQSLNEFADLKIKQEKRKQHVCCNCRGL